MIPITLAVLVFIPQTEPEGKKKEQESPQDTMPYKNVLALAGAAFVINAMYAVILTQVAVVVTELKIGSASTAGVMGSLGTIGSLCACLSFGFIYIGANIISRLSLPLLWHWDIPDFTFQKILSWWALCA